MVENVIQFPLERRLDTILHDNGPAEVVLHPAMKDMLFVGVLGVATGDVMLPADVEPSE